MVKKTSKSADRHKNPTLTCRCPPEEIAALKEIMRKERRTQAAVIRFALKFYANEHNHAWPDNDTETDEN